MNKVELDQWLTDHNIRPTGNRIIILQILADARRPLSLAEIEQIADTLDKSTVFRTLTTFRAAHLVHTIEDEMGVLRFEICTGHHSEEGDDQHVHFYCTVCQRLICLTEIAIPSVVMPEGYTAEATTYIVKGVCPSCRK